MVWKAEVWIDSDDDFEVDLCDYFFRQGESKEDVVQAVLRALNEAKFTYVKEWVSGRTVGDYSECWFELRDKTIEKLKAGHLVFSVPYGNQSVLVKIGNVEAPATYRDPVYTCKGKGGRYVVVGTAKGAGTSKGSEVEVYKDLQTGQIYFRTLKDFDDRMEELPQ